MRSRPAAAPLAASLLVAFLAAGCDGGHRGAPRGRPARVERSGAASSASPTAAPGGARPPNVLIVVTDDQRADQTLRVMPETRRLFSRGGTRFTNAFATTPLCCPSRASILTGRYAHNHGVQTNYDPSPLAPRSTLPRYLQGAGYQTAIVGKYLNSWDVATPPPFFDRWSIEDAYDYYDTRVNVDGRVRIVGGYLTSFLRRRALRYLRAFERRDDTPWFLYVAPLAPHEPFTPEERYRRAPVPPPRPDPALARGADGKPRWLRDHTVGRRWKRQLPRRQLRTLRSVDDLVDALFASIERADEAEDTLAFFTSDNGYLWGEFGVTEKRLPYDPSTRVPLLVRWPGHVAAGAIDRSLVANIDIAPTVLAAASIRAGRRYAIDGTSLLSGEPRERLLLEYFRDPQSPVPAWASTRTRSYQYIEYYDDSGAVAFREYYDLTGDASQLENLLADAPRSNDPDLGALSRRLARDRRCSGRACP